MVDSLNSIDKSNLRQVILETPGQFEVGFSLAKNIKVEGEFSNVTISGMGGSALPANLLRTYCNSLFKTHPNYKPFEIYINRYYSLPPESHSSNTLNFISSYSGNTEEAISSLEEAHMAGLKFVGFSSGGKVEELCKQYGAPHIKLPIPNPNFQPRMGTGYFFASMFQLLVNQGLIPDISSELLSLAGKLRQHMGEHENQGKELAGKLRGKTPVIYSSPKYEPAAMIWKIKINENAKTPAFWNFFPEANHNEMVGFTNPQGKFFIIMLKDSDDDPRNLKRYEATQKLLQEKGIESEIVEMYGNDVFSKMFSSLNLADWTSYYLALEYGQDPTPVDMVESLKKILAS
ncbi:MAG: bifunctional phosphoglucose/phosphomannose isomerase [Candidatus Levybacteria bacterium]|nr:bifunctional phosphoglucose/phosphomannose isomerase [Candidatus Levybacteria bacterium]